MGRLQMVEAAAQPESLVALTIAVYSQLVDEMTREVAEDVHRAAHDDALDWITIPADLVDTDSGAVRGPDHSSLVRFPDRPDNVALEQVDCPHCDRQLAATRFAAHLEKCLLGKGRNARGTKRVNYTE